MKLIELENQRKRREAGLANTSEEFAIGTDAPNDAEVEVDPETPKQRPTSGRCFE